MNKDQLKTLETKLHDFANKLSQSDRTILQDILWSIGDNLYDIASIFKNVGITLIPKERERVLIPLFTCKSCGQRSVTENICSDCGIPRDKTTSSDPLPQVTAGGFKPQAKVKGDPLQELASALSSEDREKLIAKLGGK